MTRRTVAPRRCAPAAEGGERPTPRADRPVPPAPADHRPRDGHQAAEDLDDYVKEVVDALPPLTGKQRDVLANLLRARP
jgi:hypothetical protein